MSQFRLIQISDTHLARRLRQADRQLSPAQPNISTTGGRTLSSTAATSPSMAPTSRDDLEFARGAARRPFPSSACRVLPGNHDIGDNPTKNESCPPYSCHRKEPAGLPHGIRRGSLALRGCGLVFHRPQFADDADRIMKVKPSSLSGLGWELSNAHGKPVALFLHKPLYLNTPEDPEIAASAIRYIPPAPRTRLMQLLEGVDLRLVASGHVHQRRDFTFGHIRHIWRVIRRLYPPRPDAGSDLR